MRGRQSSVLIQPTSIYEDGYHKDQVKVVLSEEMENRLSVPQPRLKIDESKRQPFLESANGTSAVQDGKAGDEEIALFSPYLASDLTFSAFLNDSAVAQTNPADAQTLPTEAQTVPTARRWFRQRRRSLP